MVIRGASVYTENEVFEDKTIEITEDTFTDIREPSPVDLTVENKINNKNKNIDINRNKNKEKIQNLNKNLNKDEEFIDVTECYAIPGLIDIHFHGCMGVDFCDGDIESVRKIAEYEASQGVTSIIPATMTYDEDRLIKIAETAKEFMGQNGRSATLYGINMEGPFVSIEKCGAQNPQYIHKPDYDMFKRINSACGNKVKLVDIAPETDGAMEFIKKTSQDTRISIAHTTADYETAVEAFENGARQMTHLFNAMPGLHHRNPGPIAAAADREDITAEIICDNVHITPVMVRMSFKLFGPKRLIFISDTMEAAGLEDGEYQLGGQPVTVRGKLATLHDGTIAGSVTNLMKCMRTAVIDMGIPLTYAVRCATINPAKAMGLYDELGSITKGKKADLVLLDKKTLSVKCVLIRGHLL